MNEIISQPRWWLIRLVKMKRWLIWLISRAVLQPHTPEKRYLPRQQKDKKKHVCTLKLRKTDGSIVFTDSALKYVSSSPKMINFLSTHHAQKIYYHTSIRSFTSTMWNRLLPCNIYLDFSAGKGCSWNEMWWTCVLPLPLSRKTNDQQVVAFLPVAHMHQMFPEQERRTKEKGEELKGKR